MLLYTYPRRAAFTLVELSVVLAIIGLLIGSIMVGREMIRGQELRKVLTDAKNYGVALRQFEDKYKLPAGDLSNAEQLWGNAEGGSPTTNCVTPSTSASTNGITTCNGNGSGNIDTLTEAYWAWQHMSAAGMITGRYSGINDAIGAPKAPWSPATFNIFNAANLYWVVDSSNTLSTWYFDGDYRDAILLTSIGAGGLTGQKAYWLDAKADDGMPATGKILGSKPILPSPPLVSCVTSATSSATYDLDESKSASALYNCTISFMASKAEVAQ